MQTIVQIHIGPSLPGYFGDTVRQTRRFHAGPLVLVVSQQLLGHADVCIHECKIVPYEPLLDSARIEALQGRSYNNVLLIEKAVSNKSGKIKFYQIDREKTRTT